MTKMQISGARINDAKKDRLKFRKTLSRTDRSRLAIVMAEDVAVEYSSHSQIGCPFAEIQVLVTLVLTFHLVGSLL